MQHHHLTSTATTHARNHDGPAEPLMHPAAIGERDTGPSAGRGRAHLTLAGPPVWRHKLILTGRLDHRTAADFEDEIECLCEEGVTILTLDLRQLVAIDAAGARTIAFRGTVYRSRGRDFAVIPGSPAIHDALTEAGADSLLADDPGETGIPLLHLASSSSERASRDMSTAMIKHL